MQPAKTSRKDVSRQVILAGPVVQAARRHRLLSGLMTVGAGYFSGTGLLGIPALREPGGALLCYCLKGRGRCVAGGQSHLLRAGELLFLGADVACQGMAAGGRPWTVFWVAMTGSQIRDYLEHWGGAGGRLTVRAGEDLQLVALFNEVLACLEQARGFAEWLRASQALGHLLAVAIQHQGVPEGRGSDGVHKVARSIEYMSGHLDQPLRMAALAALANLCPAHFTVLFKEQTGCSPRDYLHLLRMHRACQWLETTDLAVKEIAVRLGYHDQFHFSRKFKAFRGLSPTEYRLRRAGGLLAAQA